jgi:Flp pilus assembly protein TadG
MMRQSLRPTGAGLRADVRAAMRRFAREEDGSMIIFGLFLMITMLIVAGMAVDLMRYESDRTRLQATLDRAVLAAADLDQTMDPQTVVENYFEVEGLLDMITSINVVQSPTSRTVTADAEMMVPTMFMDMVGLDELEAPAAGTAIEAVADIEIILVLDVSGSMAQPITKLNNLKAAAVEFVNTVLADDPDNRISIGIVPFNGQVNLGPVLRTQYTGVYDLHGNTGANCVDLPAAAYLGSDIATNIVMPATSLADTFSGTSLSGSYIDPYNNSGQGLARGVNRWCPPLSLVPGAPGTASNDVLLPTTNVTALNNHINNMYAVGATSINAGLRWGTELLDPGSRAMFNALRGQPGGITGLNGRPFDYTRDNTVKIVVLMTDGSHFAEERVTDGFRIGNSPIYRASDGLFSIFHSSRLAMTNTEAQRCTPFYYPFANSGAGGWYQRPWNGSYPAAAWTWGTKTEANCYMGTTTLPATQPTSWGTTVVRQTWQQVWTQLRMTWVVGQLYSRPLSINATTRQTDYNNRMGVGGINIPGVTMRQQTAIADMDAQLEALCTSSDTNGILIFGIAFQAPAAGEAVIQDCASAPAYYFDAANNTQLREAFRSISTQISLLRLTQ